MSGLRMEKRGGFNSPIHACLPSRVVEAVKHVQEHRTDVAIRCPVIDGEIFLSCVFAGVVLLERVTASPDGHGYGEQDSPANPSSNPSRKPRPVKRVAEGECADNLHEPVQGIVQSLRPGVEFHPVDVVELVGVEPIGCEKHGEEKEDVWVGLESLPQAVDFGPPCWILHENDSRSIRADYALCAHKTPCEDGAESGQDQETDISARRHG